jgi:hypothetical protein
MKIGDRVRTPSGFTGVIVAAQQWALVRRDDLPGWGPVPYDFFELELAHADTSVRFGSRTDR